MFNTATFRADTPAPAILIWIPVFASGINGDYYLSQISASQAQEQPLRGLRKRIRQ